MWEGFKKKWSNYWYHYKMITIIGACVLAIAGYAVYSIVTIQRPDIIVLLACNAPISQEQQSLLEVNLEKYTPDFNGDKKTIVEVRPVYLYESASDTQLNNTIQQDNKQKLIANLSAGESTLFLLDDAAYQIMYQSGTFENLEEKYQGMPAIVKDKCYLSAMPFSDNAYLESLKDKLYFTVRALDTMPKNNKKSVQEQYQQALQVLDNMLNNRVVKDMPVNS